MLRKRVFFRKTRKGGVLKTVREHYLRDDIPCGSALCETCQIQTNRPGLSDDVSRCLVLTFRPYLIVDTNVIIHQMDVISHPAVVNVVILQTVLEEVRHRDLFIYRRLKELLGKNEKQFYMLANEHLTQTYVERNPGESPNDRNDRAIRVATNWYIGHLKGAAKVVMVTDDKANRDKALAAGFPAQTAKQLVRELSVTHPELLDVYVQWKVDKATEFFFPPHLTTTGVKEALAAGKAQQGVLHMNTNNYLEGYVTLADGSELLVQGSNDLNRAFDSDVVAVEPLPREAWKAPSTLLRIQAQERDEEVAEDVEGRERVATARVIGIVRRKWKQYPGTLRQRVGDNQTCFFLPNDRRIPMVRIQTRQAQSLLDKIVIVGIDSWERTSKHPRGHYVRTLGEAGDKGAQTQALLVQYDIPFQPFSQKVLDCLPPPNWQAEAAGWPASRVDLRHLPICSVDPPGCTDIDDALHIFKLPNGNFEAGVHIADVSHFVKEGSAVDEEAANRGTTVYFTDRRIDMLPGLLGTNLCSLQENVDRFAFSCIWELTPDGHIVNTRFTKSVIRSQASLTYEEAQLKIDDKSRKDALSESLRQLNRIAKLIRARRMTRGALTLSSPQIKFKLESDLEDPVDMEMYQMRETNAMVEEFMLLANISVAEKIFESFPSSALLRRHPTPTQANFDRLVHLGELMGAEIKTSSSKALADSLDAAKFDDPYLNEMLRILATRSMTQAIYFSSGSLKEEEFHHYGLATAIYTHFTSPIRRYADVIVHRLLASAIGVEGASLALTNSKVQGTCDHINRRARAAQIASRGSVEIHAYLFFKDRTEVTVAYVTRLMRNGFNVLIKKYGLEGLIYVTADPLGPNPWTLDEETQQLTGPGGVCIKLFQKVKVKLSADPEAGKLKFECLDPELSGAVPGPSNSPTPKRKERADKRKSKRMKV